jgi:hypothetical protein
LDSGGVAAVGFDQMEASLEEQRFIESGSVPADANVVGSTWKYVNKKGGPDRRFSDNREIPIALYEEMLLTSTSGLREEFQLSRTGVGAHVKSALTAMASAIFSREEDKPEAGYIKCPCNNCDVLIEFPAHGVGESIKCPHCGMDTVLFNPASQEG